MATDLNTLVAKEKAQKDALEQDVAAGATAQAKLLQVASVYDDLLAIQKRQAALAGGADARLANAKSRAAAVTAGLAPIDTMLASLPGGLKLKDLDDIVAKDLPKPPTASLKKWSEYVTALATAQTNLDTAQNNTERLRLAATRAQEDLALAEADVASSTDRAARAADDAEASLADALRARGAGDFARAYWLEARAKALIAVVNAPETQKAVDDAKTALLSAANAYANATDKRLTAEADLVKKQADRTKAADQLGDASSQVLDALVAAIAKAKAP
ncbi:Hypothetical protein A7982_02252 [Minicystis rosea]|nr:Hypothetical protein A7982_02252 [Minicystis rosea]